MCGRTPIGITVRYTERGGVYAAHILNENGTFDQCEMPALRDTLKSLSVFDIECRCSAAAGSCAVALGKELLSDELALPPERRCLVWQTVDAGAVYYRKMLDSLHSKQLVPDSVYWGPLSSFNGPLTAVALKERFEGIQMLLIGPFGDSLRLKSTAVSIANAGLCQGPISLTVGMSGRSADARDAVAMVIHWPMVREVTDVAGIVKTFNDLTNFLRAHS